MAFFVVAIAVRPVPAAGTPSEPVTAELVADHAAVRPGGEFRLAVRLQLQPGWHVYWQYPGPAGLATQIQFRLPPGFEADPFQWPLPRRFGAPDVGEGFGYEREVLFMARVRVPEGLVPGTPLVFAASCRWLACREVCRLGRAELELSLRTAAAEVPVRMELFREWDARLPDPAGAAGVPVGVPSVSGSLPPEGGPVEFRVELAWREPPATVEWFPVLPDSLELAHIRLETSGTLTVLRFQARELAGQRWAGPVMNSLLVFTDRSGRRRGVELPLRLRP